MYVVLQIAVSVSECVGCQERQVHPLFRFLGDTGDGRPRPRRTGRARVSGLESMPSKCKAPVPFGSYEVGRSKLPANKKPTAAFRDRMPQHNQLEPTGDPGAYNPVLMHELVGSGSYSATLVRPAFGTSATQRPVIEESPGPASYQVEEARKKSQYPATSPNISIFRSGSLQRPSGKTVGPGAGTYSPNMNSVHANQRDSGAQMRSAGSRWGHEQSMTEAMVGPGSYEQLEGSLYVSAQKSMSKASKVRPAFGSTATQRPVIEDSPGPGAYEPIEPRVQKSKKKPATPKS